LYVRHDSSYSGPLLESQKIGLILCLFCSVDIDI
jgi:hypothetical protein